MSNKAKAAAEDLARLEALNAAIERTIFLNGWHYGLGRTPTKDEITAANEYWQADYDERQAALKAL
jgi:hypothetical protein